MGRLAAALAAAALLGVGAAVAQAPPPDARGLSLPQMAVVVLDREALYANSRFGRRVREDVASALQALAAENRRMEAELEAEEQQLTQRRAGMEPAAFRGLAEAFDARVDGIRQTQDAKERAITQANERAQAIFFERAAPVLRDLARDSGALVILDRRIVIAAADQVDITAEAVERIDAVLGDGDGLDALREDADAASPGAAGVEDR